MEKTRSLKYWHVFWLIFLIGGFLFFFILDPLKLPVGIGYTIGAMSMPTAISAAVLHFSKSERSVRGSYVLYILLILVLLGNRTSDTRKDIVASYIEGCTNSDAVSAYYPDRSMKVTYCTCVGDNIASKVLLDSMTAKALLRDRNVDFVSGGIDNLVNGAAERCMTSISP